MLHHLNHRSLATPAAMPAAAPPVPRRMRRCRAHLRVLVLLFSLVAGMLPWNGSAAESQTVDEYKLKAALLPKLALFVEWPGTAFSASGGPLFIGVLGDDPFGPHLETIVRGKSVGNHPLKVQHCRDLDEAARCHMVFISSRDPRLNDDALNKLARAGVLTVSDAPGFCSQGGMVNLVTVNKKVQIEVNLETAQGAGLRIDPQLLQLAKVVKNAPPKPKP